MLSQDFINSTDRKCECGLTLAKIVYKSVFTAANVMLNNYTRTVNDKVKGVKKSTKKRKLATLTGK